MLSVSISTPNKGRATTWRSSRLVDRSKLPQTPMRRFLSLLSRAFFMLLSAGAIILVIWGMIIGPMMGKQGKFTFQDFRQAAVEAPRAVYTYASNWIWSLTWLGRQKVEVSGSLSMLAQNGGLDLKVADGKELLKIAAEGSAMTPKDIKGDIRGVLPPDETNGAGATAPAPPPASLAKPAQFAKLGGGGVDEAELNTVNAALRAAGADFRRLEPARQAIASFLEKHSDAATKTDLERRLASAAETARAALAEREAPLRETNKYSAPAIAAPASKALAACLRAAGAVKSIVVARRQANIHPTIPSLVARVDGVQGDEALARVRACLAPMEKAAHVTVFTDIGTAGGAAAVDRLNRTKGALSLKF